jgi:hypothetical protein
MAASALQSLNIGRYGKLYFFFSETTNLIESKHYMNSLLSFLLIFLSGLEIQDGHQRALLEIGPYWKTNQNAFFLRNYKLA